MDQKIEMSPKLRKWREWMKAIEPEIRLLLRDARVFWEIQIIIHGHQRTQDFHYGYLERSYLDHVLARLHQHIKPHKQCISFVGLLHEIAENPEEFSRGYVDAASSGTNDTTNVALGKTHVRSQMVTEDIAQLTSALEACKTFADERFAYWKKHESKNVPLSKELNACFKLLDKIYVKYHTLFYGEGLKTLQPPRQAGTLKGLIHSADDFDAELPEFREYMW